MDQCPAFEPVGAYVTSLLGTIDCRSLALAENGYRAFGPGSGFGAALAAMLTIAIALLGYRVMMGGLMGMGEWVMTALRFGLVLTLATQWAAWQPLVFDLATRAPDELAGTVLGLGSDSATAMVTARLQALTNRIDAMATAPEPANAAGLAPTPAPASTAIDGAPSAPTSNAVNLPLEARKSIVTAEQWLLIAALGGLIAVRVLAALLLALGPPVVTLLLFSATRGLVLGWARALIGAALGALVMPLLLALALPLFESQVGALAHALATNSGLGTLPDRLWMTSAVFAVAVLTALVGVARLAAGLDWPASAMAIATLQARVQPGVVLDRATNPMAWPERGQTENLVDAVSRAGRRETGSDGAIPVRRTIIDPLAASQADATRDPRPLGETGRRRAMQLSPTTQRREAIR